MAKFDFIIGDDGRAKPVIPVTVFLTTEEEKAAMIEAAKRRTLRLIKWHPIELRNGEIVGSLPEVGDEVLITDDGGNVRIEEFCGDESSYWFEFSGMDEVRAWAPLPEPYKPSEEEGTTC